jgi:hypothetical protein
MTAAYTAPVRRINRGKGHRYEDANGITVPGVTTILGDGVPKPALVNWAATATADAAIDRWAELADMPPAARLKALTSARHADRDAAANKGTAVHGLAEQLVRGERVDVPPALEGHVASYVRFLDEWAVEPVLVETVVVSHSYGWAGTLDLVADVPDLGRVLLDVKTSRSGIFGETALQLAGYRFADTYVDEDGVERDMLEVDSCGAVHVRADGYDLIPVEAGPEQLQQLRHVQQVARFAKASRDLVGDPLPPPSASRVRLVREAVDADV